MQSQPLSALIYLQCTGRYRIAASRTPTATTSMPPSRIVQTLFQRDKPVVQVGLGHHVCGVGDLRQ
jgi:hypothetical protein